MSNLVNFLLKSETRDLFKVFNLIVSAFGAVMMFRMKTETSTKEHPWTKHLAIALSIFAIQYFVFWKRLDEGPFPLLKVSNPLLWSEFFGIPINLFLMSSANILLNRRRWWPRWFLVMIAIDVLAVIVGIIHHTGDESYDLISTLCRVAGDLITFISLIHVGFASYINSRFYKDHTGIVLGIAIGLLYGGIHAFSPFVPNIAHAYSSPELTPQEISQPIGIALTFVASLFKLAILYSAFLITSLENHTLIRLRDSLRESVEDRNVFFSRWGIFRAIAGAFGADAVKLYIKVAAVGDPSMDPPVHVYSAPSKTQFEVVNECDTPLPQLLSRLTQEREGDDSSRAGRSGVPPLSTASELARTKKTPDPLEGIEAIRYHGGLIGCLTIEKKGSRPFTYAAERLRRVVSEDISALVQFYRAQESLRVLIEALNRNLERLSYRQLNSEFEAIIQQVLSPLETHFVINTGFIPAEKAANGNIPSRTDNHQRTTFECVSYEGKGGLTIGHIHLQYAKKRDPLGKPSLGHFLAHRNAVTSIVTRSFLACVDQRLNLIIRKLSLELTKKLDFDDWFEKIQNCAKDADLDGTAVLCYPEIPDVSRLMKGNQVAGNSAVGEALASAFENSQQVLESLEDSPCVVLKTPDRLILGMKLKFSSVPGAAGLFVGVRRLEFANELGGSTPWTDFLTKLADVTGNALERIMQAKQLQRHQIQRAEDYMVLQTAEEIKLITHELINHVEKLASNNALMKFEIPSGLDEATKALMILRCEEMSNDFDELRSMTANIRRSAKIQERSDPSYLILTLRELKSLHESRNNIEIDLKGITNRSASSASSKTARDIQVELTKDIIKLTFGNLIRNSIAAIKRKLSAEKSDPGDSNSRGLITIWAEVHDGDDLIHCFVRDNGPGIPPEAIDSIFDLNVSVAPGHGGWGLFHVRRMLEMNGASISVDHSAPDNTTFRVNLRKYVKK